MFDSISLVKWRKRRLPLVELYLIYQEPCFLLAFTAMSHSTPTRMKRVMGTATLPRGWVASREELMAFLLLPVRLWISGLLRNSQSHCIRDSEFPFCVLLGNVINSICPGKEQANLKWNSFKAFLSFFAFYSNAELSWLEMASCQWSCQVSCLSGIVIGKKSLLFSVGSSLSFKNTML